jgi:DNA-directed RNA polymerase subunit F
MPVIGKKVLDEKPITLAETREIMEKALKDDEEPIYEQTITMEYLKKFVKLKPEEARELVEKLASTNERIKREIIIKLVDLLPQDDEDIRVVFAKERYALTKDELGSLLQVIKEKA